jgi:flagellin
MANFSVLNNIPSLFGRNQINSSAMQLQKAMLRLSSGSRINSGADDAAGLAIADGLRAQVGALRQASRNANDGVGYLQVADGALSQVTDLLTRAVTLAEESATGTVDDTKRAAIQSEFSAITAEIDRIGTDTKYNGVAIFGGAATDIFVGDTTTTSTISFTVQSLDTSAVVDGAGANTQDVSGQDLSSAQGAQDALAVINDAISNIADQRAVLGGAANRLVAAQAVIQSQSQNLQAAESQIRDADMAEEISNMSRLQILQQTGMAALATANSSAQGVLQLFR